MTWKTLRPLPRAMLDPPTFYAPLPAPCPDVRPPRCPFLFLFLSWQARAWEFSLNRLYLCFLLFLIIFSSYIYLFKPDICPFPLLFCTFSPMFGVRYYILLCFPLLLVPPLSLSFFPFFFPFPFLAGVCPSPRWTPFLFPPSPASPYMY